MNQVKGAGIRRHGVVPSPGPRCAVLGTLAWQAGDGSRHQAARSGDRTRRPGLPGRQQPEAGRFSGQGAGAVGPGAGARPAHGAVGAGAARASRPVRDRHRREAGFLVFRAAGCAVGQDGFRQGTSRSARSTPTWSLFSRYFVDSDATVSLVGAHAADAQGNLYTGPNTEDTPAIVEATAFNGGIVIAQVNELVATGCRASTSRPTGSTLSSRHPGPISLSRCSRATRRRSPRSRC